MTFHHARCVLVCLLHIYLLAEIFEDLRDLDLLRADLFTAAAADAGAGALVFRHCGKRKRSDESAACKDMFIIKLNQFRNIQPLRAV